MNKDLAIIKGGDDTPKAVNRWGKEIFPNKYKYIIGKGETRVPM